MADVILVDDPDDPRLDDYRHLTDADLRRRIETGAGDGLFVAEGTLVIRSLLTSQYPVRSLLLTPERHAELAADLTATHAPAYVAPLDVLRRVAGFDIHRGALASAARRPLRAVDQLLDDATRVAVVEGVNDHENLGAVFRNAAAFGIDAVLLDPTTCDPLYRRCVRVSMGHVLHVPWTRLDPWPTALDAVRSAGFTVAALTPSSTAVDVRDAGLERQDHVALLLGAERHGLTDAALAAADVHVRIAMADGVDSLNVATAAAIAFDRTRPRA